MSEQETISRIHAEETETHFSNENLSPSEHFAIGSTPAVSATENLFTLDQVDEIMEKDPDIFYIPISLITKRAERDAVVAARKNKRELRNTFQAFQTHDVYTMFDDGITPVLSLAAPNEQGLIEEARFRFEGSTQSDPGFQLRPELQKLFPFRTVGEAGEVIFKRNQEDTHEV